jgi:NADH:ubiquinone oxidoreductase subunit H
MKAWPLLAVSSAAGAVALLPVLPSSGGFEGDLILLLALLEVPSMCIIAAGFSSRAPSSARLARRAKPFSAFRYNVVFLLAIVSIAASQHTFRLEALAQLPASPLRWLGVLAILVCLPAKLHLNPFSLPNAEQEIYSGP